MTDTKQSVDSQQVKCEVCLKEIPRSEARSAEASEYIAYFCGFDCYQEWIKNSSDQQPQPRPKDKS